MNRWNGAILIAAVAVCGTAEAQPTESAEDERIAEEMDALRRELFEAATSPREPRSPSPRPREGQARENRGDPRSKPVPARAPIRAEAGDPDPVVPLVADSDESALDHALDSALNDLQIPDESADSNRRDLASFSAGDATFRLIELSVDLLFAVGSSSEKGEALRNLQGGGHDPRKRGFTFQNLELSVLGAVDPYLTAEAHLIYFLDPDEGESEFELEEAFFTTLQLPFGLHQAGLQLEAGQMMTEFGRHNPQHPHAWVWLDQPVIHNRVFGPDGMRGVGARLGWLTPLPWFSEVHVGIQNANGETMASFLANDEFFEERAIGGRPFVDRSVSSLQDFAYLARWVNSWDLSDEVTIALGGSALAGPNSTGRDGRTFVYGGDLILSWRPLDAERGWPFVVWQTEYVHRRFHADRFADTGDPLDPGDDVFFRSSTLGDYGVYTQLLWGFLRNWAIGARVEHASGSGASVGIYPDRDSDPFRSDRLRVAPLLLWQPSEYSRIRLQYNFDDADHLSDDAHSVWLGFEVLFGRHPAHTY